MKPEEIFTSKGYDMVVAVRLDAINRQLLKLGDFGAIDYTLYIEADVDADDNWVYSLKSRPQEIILDPTTGRPKKPTLIGEYRPFFEATPGNSRTIMLSVVFRSGQLWAPGASGNTKAPVDISRWTFHMEVRVDFVELQAGAKGIRTRVLQKRLEEFTSRGFTVSQLFCDFQSVDLLGTSASVTTSTDTAASVTTMFKNCLIDGYLAELKKNPDRNPYTLGYFAKPAPQSTVDLAVPDSLNPIGNTFNVYYDADYPHESTLNFILNTKDSALPAGTHPFPDSFDERWIPVNSVCDGKMAYSFRAFMETMVLEQFYEDYSESMHRQISEGGIEIGPSRTYAEAKQKTISGYHFDVQNQHSGINNENRYVTHFDASWSTTPTGFSVKIEGFLHWYKEKTKYVTDLLGRTKRARAWMGCDMTWDTNIDISLKTDDAGKPTLGIFMHPLRKLTNRTWKDQNGVAADFSSIGAILGPLIDIGSIFSLFVDDGWFTSGLLALSLVKLPKKLVVRDIPLDTALQQISQVAATAIFLPAGDVFRYKSLEVSGGGVMSMLVDYKPE
ncbi:hypothetical protein VTL71DRAFT_1264 [Oculimacula yallundae]|uniref:Uncharacterized protein n=1 Tax=Oculimacula yallundae TaxID=86028 RepID=A0ABR4CA70_9HELO